MQHGLTATKDEKGRASRVKIEGAAQTIKHGDTTPIFKDIWETDSRLLAYRRIQ